MNEDKRKTYLTPEKRIEQAKRVLPVVEAEIAGGETRQIFFDIRDMCLRDLKQEYVLPEEFRPYFETCECVGTAKCVTHFLEELDNE